jgi:hypothetical protein
MSLSIPPTPIPKTPNSRIRVRLFAVQAAIAAAGMAVAPAPVAIAMDIAGLDPVLAAQRRMLLRLGVEQPMSRPDRRNDRHRSLEQVRKQQVVDGATRLVVHVAQRTRYGVHAAKYVGRAVPIVGSILAAIVAYRRTAALGFETLSSGIADSQENSRII